MEVLFLGSGTAVPVRQHSPSGLIIKTEGQCLLFDIGPGTLGRLQLVDVDYAQIDHLLLTHLHPDHTLDLATLLLVFNYAPNAERTAPFPITGCRGVEAFFKRMVDLYPEVAPVSFELQFREVYREEFAIGNVSVRTAPTAHTPESVAYRVSTEKHSVVYSGDASPRGELARLAEGADLLISECSFPKGWETEDHLNAETVAEIARQAGVKSLVVTHCYPPALAVDLVAQIRGRFQGEVQVAVDGLRLSV